MNAQENNTLESCRVKLGKNRYDAECGSITVPENRQDPNARHITLPIIRIPATGTEIAEPIFHLQGGPGMSNLDFEPPAALLKNHDFVLVGYRGIDGDVVLDCPEFSDALSGIKSGLFSEVSQAAMADAIGSCSSRLRQSGIDLDGYNIVEVAEDIEAARIMLGYDKIHLLSQSYGTRVAQIYAQLYPEYTFRSVMIGINPPGRFVWEPEMIDQQLALFNEFCAKDVECGQQNDDVVAMMRQVNESMPERWLFFSIDPDKVQSIAFVLLFQRSTAVYVFDTYQAAANGDASGLALMSLAFDMMIPNMSVWGDFLAKGFSADFESSRDYTQLDAPDSVMGSPLAQLFWPNAQNWSMAPIPEVYRKSAPSSVETLLISGNVDFSTPAPYATNDLLPTLENGQQIILTDMGHTGDFWDVQSEAAERLLVQYFDNGIADDSLFTHIPFSFKTGLMRLPLIAKLLIIVPLLLVMALGLLIRKLVKRRRA
ncbi:MAG: alpha/beta fold hydrolase [Chloroflexi bacterium]|nr:alpha/beta fold hydrolase [Chloroflexota bacterium]